MAKKPCIESLTYECLRVHAIHLEPFFEICAILRHGCHAHRYSSASR